MRHRPSFFVAREALYSARVSSCTIQMQNLHCGELWQQSSAPGTCGSDGGFATHWQNRRWQVSQSGGGGGRSSGRRAGALLCEGGPDSVLAIKKQLFV